MSQEDGNHDKHVASGVKHRGSALKIPTAFQEGKQGQGKAAVVKGVPPGLLKTDRTYCREDKKQPLVPSPLPSRSPEAAPNGDGKHFSSARPQVAVEREEHKADNTSVAMSEKVKFTGTAKERELKEIASFAQQMASLHIRPR